MPRLKFSPSLGVAAGTPILILAVLVTYVLAPSWSMHHIHVAIRATVQQPHR